MSVLPKNKKLVFSIPGYESEIFSISSLVKISLTSFLCFSFVFCLVFLLLKHSYLCTNKKKITHWFEYMKWKKDFTSERSLKIKMFKEIKIRMFIDRR